MNLLGRDIPDLGNSRVNKGCHIGLPPWQPPVSKLCFRQPMTMGFRLVCIPECFLSPLTEKRDGVKAGFFAVDKIVFRIVGCFFSVLWSKISSIMLNQN